MSQLSKGTVALLLVAVTVGGLPIDLRTGDAAPLPSPAICEETMRPSPAAPALRLPICFSRPLGTGSSAVEQVVIVIHGLGRTAVEEGRIVAAAAARVSGGPGRSLVVSPQFPVEDDLAARGLGEEFLYWNRWQWGDLSLSLDRRPRPERVSSFAAVDRIVETVIDRSLHPNLRHVVVFGHSAGGQFVNRYAAGSRRVQAAASAASVDVRFVVANPSSYLYFTSERPSERPTGAFAVPPPALQSACPRFDDYGYGLRDLNPYMSDVGADQIKRQYGEREVFHLLGAQDNDPGAPFLDTSCQANLQGRHRLERGLTYHRYLLHLYGPAAAERLRVAIVGGLGHSTRGVVESACGRRFVLVDPTAQCADAYR